MASRTWTWLVAALLVAAPASGGPGAADPGCDRDLAAGLKDEADRLEASGQLPAAYDALVAAYAWCRTDKLQARLIRLLERMQVPGADVARVKDCLKERKGLRAMLDCTRPCGTGMCPSAAGATASGGSQGDGPPAPPGFVRIPAGEFTMGSPTTEPTRSSDEGPQHRVRITRSFLLKTTEVTQGEWQALMGNNPASIKACGKDCPVETISWWDALAYCNARSAKEGLPSCYQLLECKGTPGDGKYECKDVTFKGLGCRGYRLPTEAEWEYAARAGSTSALYTGDLTLKGENHAPELDPIAWYGGNNGVEYSAFSCSNFKERQYESARCGTHPVGGKRPNAFGLLDMIGNILEWTWDRKGTYTVETQTDPTGAPSGASRVLRGGGWTTKARYLRVAYRQSDVPTFRANYVGFRPARSL